MRLQEHIESMNEKVNEEAVKKKAVAVLRQFVQEFNKVSGFREKNPILDRFANIKINAEDVLRDTWKAWKLR